MKSVLNRKLTSFAVIIVVATIPIASLFYARAYWMVEPLIVGQPIPSTSVETLDGRTVSIASLLKKKSVVLFFSVTCSHCRNEIQSLLSIYLKFNKSLDFAAISLDPREETKDFMMGMGIPFPVFVDARGEAKSSFHVRPVPALFFVDEHKRLMRYRAGEESAQELAAMLEEFAVSRSDSAMERQ